LASPAANSTIAVINGPLTSGNAESGGNGGHGNLGGVSP